MADSLVLYYPLILQYTMAKCGMSFGHIYPLFILEESSDWGKFTAEMRDSNLSTSSEQQRRINPSEYSENDERNHLCNSQVLPATEIMNHNKTGNQTTYVQYFNFCEDFDIPFVNTLHVCNICYCQRRFSQP